MIPEIKALYQPQILEKAQTLFRFKEFPQDLGGFESYVYRFHKKDKTFIMKITHSTRRTVEYLMGVR